MRPPARWPLHPAPLEGEALSSWLRRIAANYDMSVASLLEHGLGDTHTTEQDLDLDPAQQLLVALAERTGIDPTRTRVMSLAGWTPWLVGSIEATPTAFDTYVHQFSVLLKPGKKSKRHVGPWRAWIADQPVQRACPVCLADPDRQGMLLMWRLPLLRSCPEHGCLLEPCLGLPGTLIWPGDDQRPRDATATVQAMDRRTHEGITTGRVQLPRRPVRAAVWFRLLRTCSTNSAPQRPTGAGTPTTSTWPGPAPVTRSAPRRRPGAPSKPSPGRSKPSCSTRPPLPSTSYRVTT